MFRFASSSRTALLLSRRSFAVFNQTVTPLNTLSFKGNVSQVNARTYSISTAGTFGPVDPPKNLTIKEVEQKVIKAIKAWDRFPQDRADKLTLEARFVEDLGFDSLDLVEITMALEDEFGFEIPESDVDKLKTPRDIQKYICEHEDVLE
ncbi:unnamed protein product [Bursaphelenchus okinawaensis]|uniref:Acyl carrier protein n=1 Tax=Bursaphelenchus okinawaensis TaxID=465554 RepID=A0A811K7E9_9BILA|nr:unnamed protein product [Bursaphelenchus okinawaensis]CAG9094870.1 unnamed protein product [Bursaphelenchus okinawaensis]